jgi:Flp pilus assembly pilin Flp
LGADVRFDSRHRRPPEGASTLEYAIMLVLGAVAIVVLLWVVLLAS